MPLATAACGVVWPSQRAAHPTAARGPHTIIKLGTRLETRRVYIVVSPWTARFTDVRRKHTAAPLSFFYTGEISP
jgi:hypothetical protein